jgi:hypothetical protein
MTVRGFVTADGPRTVEHGQFGGFPPAGGVGLPFDLGVPYAAIGTTGGHALHVGDLFGIWLDELRAVREATLPVALER